jgi:uncharacterized protein (DUF1499 family)
VKTAVLIAAALTGIVVLGLIVLGIHSRSLTPPERAGGRLPPCPASPNCVNSEYPDDTAHYIAPLTLPAEMAADAALSRLAGQIRELGGEVQDRSPDYLGATFRSRLFGFVDDLQLRPDPAQRVIHVRSASRVGHGDLGVNRRRVEALRTHWERTIKPVGAVP